MLWILHKSKAEEEVGLKAFAIPYTKADGLPSDFGHVPYFAVIKVRNVPIKAGVTESDVKEAVEAADPQLKVRSVYFDDRPKEAMLNRRTALVRLQPLRPNAQAVCKQVNISLNSQAISSTNHSHSLQCHRARDSKDQFVSNQSISTCYLWYNPLQLWKGSTNAKGLRPLPSSTDLERTAFFEECVHQREDIRPVLLMGFLLSSGSTTREWLKVGREQEHREQGEPGYWRV